MYKSTGVHIAYNSGIPRAVLFAGPQKHTAIVSSTDICFRNCHRPKVVRTQRPWGGRDMEKHRAVRSR
jgi:hypothetical protein